MDKSQKSPAGWNLDDYDYSKGKWTRGKIVTAKDAVKDMGNELNRAFNNTDPKDKEPGVTEADYEIHHHDPEGRRKAIYHHGSEYTDDVIRKDADYHQKRNPKDTIKVFKDKKPMESQGVEESLRPGEYHVWTVHFEDGTKGRIRVPNDEITDDQIKAHYAKRGKTVVKIDADWAVHSLDEAPVSNFMTSPQKPVAPEEQWKRQIRALAAQYQRNPSMLASLAKEAGPDSIEQVAWEYLQSAAKGVRMPGANTQSSPVNWDEVIRRLPQGLSGQALLNAAEEYLTGTKGMLRSQVRTLLNEPTNQLSLKTAYAGKSQPAESSNDFMAVDSTSPVGGKVTESKNYWKKLQEDRRRKAYSYLNELADVVGSDGTDVRDLINTTDPEAVKVTQRLRQEHPGAKSLTDLLLRHFNAVDQINTKQNTELDAAREAERKLRQNYDELARDNKEKEQRFQDFNRRVASMDMTPPEKARAAVDFVDKGKQPDKTNIEPKKNTAGTSGYVGGTDSVATPKVEPKATPKAEPKANQGVGLGHMAQQLKDLPSYTNVGTDTPAGTPTLPTNVSQVNFDPNKGRNRLKTGTTRTELDEISNPYQEDDLNQGAFNLEQIGNAWDDQLPSLIIMFGPNKSLRLSRAQMFTVLAIVSEASHDNDVQKSINTFKKILSNRDLTVTWLKNPTVQEFTKQYPTWQAQHQAKQQSHQQQDLLSLKGSEQHELFQETTTQEGSLKNWAIGGGAIVGRMRDGRFEIIKLHDSLLDAKRHAQAIKNKYPSMEVGIQNPTGKIAMVGVK
jgi:hypothetical protein